MAARPQPGPGPNPVKASQSYMSMYRATAAAAASEHQQIPSLRCKDKSPTPAPIMQMWYLELLRSSNHEVSDPRFSDKTIRSVIIEGSATSTAAVAFLCPHRTLTHRLRCTYWTDVLLSFCPPPTSNANGTKTSILHSEGILKPGRGDGEREECRERRVGRGGREG